MSWVLFFSLPFYSSDPRSFSVMLLQALFVTAGALAVARRPWPRLSRGPSVLLILALLLLAVTGFLSWKGAMAPLLAGTQLRAWAAWMLLAAAVALEGGARRALPWLWIPALAALIHADLSGGGWWGEGGPATARLLLTPSLALLLGLPGRDRAWWWGGLAGAGALAASVILLLYADPVELCTFLLVFVAASSRWRWAMGLALVVFAWWFLSSPHYWLEKQGTYARPQAQLNVKIKRALPLRSLPEVRGYGWRALQVARGALPRGAGPGHEGPLLAASRGSHTYDVPGAFVWEGLAAAGWLFFAALAGYLLLLALADAACPAGSECRPARCFPLGLWLLALFFPLCGLLSSPAWWALTGLLWGTLPRREAAVELPARVLVGALALAVLLICAVPLARQLGAYRIMPRPDGVELVDAESIPRIERALRWEPDNGGLHFALAHALYDKNRRESGMRLLSVDEKVLTAMKTAVEKEPFTDAYRWAYSRFLLIAGQRGEAVRQQTLATLLGPDRMEPRRQLADTYESLGRLNQALREYMACADLDPFDADLRLDIARVYGLLGETRAAQEEYAKVLRLRPDDPIARRNLNRSLPLAPGG